MIQDLKLINEVTIFFFKLIPSRFIFQVIKDDQ